MEAVRSAFTAGIAIRGLAVVVLSFLPWVTFGTRQPPALALYTLIAVGAIAAIDGSAMWAISRVPEPTDEEAYDYEEDKDPMEGTEAWA